MRPRTPTRKEASESEEAQYVRELRNRCYWMGVGSSIIAWTCSPAWRAIPTYTEPQPVVGEFTCF